MSELIKVIHNATTGEVNEVPYTAEDLEQLEKDSQEAQKLRAKEEAKAAQKAALLAKLGITEDEARLLLGGN